MITGSNPVSGTNQTATLTVKWVNDMATKLLKGHSVHHYVIGDKERKAIPNVVDMFSYKYGLSVYRITAELSNGLKYSVNAKSPSKNWNAILDAIKKQLPTL